jgi:hypothetical protein
LVLKKTIKRLTLSRETLRHLNGEELGAAHGGATIVGCTQQRCTTISYCYQCITADATDCPSCAGC